MEDVIVVDGLTKRYGDLTAVDGVSFSVKKGEIFGILGPNGAGKTTSLEMIEGLKGITAGSVYVDDRNVITEPGLVKSKIGVQLQSSAYFDHLNLIEIIETFAAMYGRSVDARALLDQIQLADKAKSYVKELSGGQKQRLSIATALVNDPVVLFLDEPTTGLDPQARRNLWDVIRTINKQGKTVVLTTHYLEEAEILCDRVAIMDYGKIIALDQPAKLIEQNNLSSQIIFKSGRAIEHDQLKYFPAVTRVKTEHPIYHLETTNPQQTLPVLYSFAGRDILDLEVRQPTLEDVFLNLTGHELRE